MDLPSGEEFAIICRDIHDAQNTYTGRTYRLHTLSFAVTLRLSQAQLFPVGQSCAKD